jgi:hypothetical protein
MDPDIWGNLPPDLIEQIALFADFDTRRALGVPPRKLPPSDIHINRGKTYIDLYVGKPHIEVTFNSCFMLVSEETIYWIFGKNINKWVRE